MDLGILIISALVIIGFGIVIFLQTKYKSKPKDTTGDDKAALMLQKQIHYWVEFTL